MQKFIFPLFFLLVAINGTAKTKVVVAKDGSGNYTSIQAAINAAPDNGTGAFIIFVKNGNYDNEKLIVPAVKTHIVLQGEDRKKTVISYHIYDCKSPESANKCPEAAYNLWKEDKDLVRTSATLTVLANDFTAENITVSNTAGPVGQALALTLRGDRCIFKNCDILGYQDTILLANNGQRNYFENCLVLGRTDYIYGGGIGFFSNCEIRSYGGGWITAPSTPENQLYGFVFDHCTFTAVTGSPRNGDDGKPVAIGRPWHQFPKVAILNSEMTEAIHPEGWPTTWNMEYASTSDKLHLFEYNNSGKGANMDKRAKWAGIRKLSDEEAKGYSLQKVLGGTDNWMPAGKNK